MPLQHSSPLQIPSLPPLIPSFYIFNKFSESKGFSAKFPGELYLDVRSLASFFWGTVMASARAAAAGGRDEESAGSGAGEDSPTSKKPRSDVRFPLSRWEFAAVVSFFVILLVGLFCIFRTMPEAEYDRILRLPRNLADLRILK